MSSMTLRMHSGRRMEVAFHNDILTALRGPDELFFEFSDLAKNMGTAIVRSYVEDFHYGRKKDVYSIKHILDEYSDEDLEYMRNNISTHYMEHVRDALNKIYMLFREVDDLTEEEEEELKIINALCEFWDDLNPDEHALEKLYNAFNGEG